jgi:BMFP domain-containing protein YqiC
MGQRRLVFGPFAPICGSKKANFIFTCAPRRCAHQIRRGRTSVVRTAPDQGIAMNNFFNDLQDKINQAIENSPAKDIERNVKAMMTQGFSKLDLVTREEFDIQAQVLAKTRAKLEALELRVAELEAKLAASESKV